MRNEKQLQKNQLASIAQHNPVQALLLLLLLLFKNEQTNERTNVQGERRERENEPTNESPRSGTENKIL